jgi:hypothetical protein
VPGQDDKLGPIGQTAVPSQQQNDRITKLTTRLVKSLDFIYAAMFLLSSIHVFFGFLMVTNEAAVWERQWWSAEKFVHLVFICGILYFLVCDWRVGRMLTNKKPYRRYSRFVVSLLIAAASYGTVWSAVYREPLVVFTLACVLAFGSLWAKLAEEEWEKELNDEGLRGDHIEFCVIRVLQLTLAAFLAAYWWFRRTKGILDHFELVGLLVAGWIFIFMYELMIPRPPGRFAGPGVPFLPRSALRAIRRRLPLDVLLGEERR